MSLRPALAVFPLMLALLLPALALGQDSDNDGSPVGVDCDDNDPNNFPGNSEVCDGQDNDCNSSADFPGGGGGTAWVQSGGGGINNADFTKGNILTASQAATITSFAMDLNVNAGVSVTLTIGEATSTGGPYTILSSTVLGAVPSGRQLHTASGLNVALTAGNVYWFGATWSGGTATNYYGSTPSNPSWGTFTSGAWSSSATAPTTGWSPGSLPGGAYDMEITSALPPTTWTQTGGGAISNGDYTKGNILLASQSTTVTSWGMELNVNTGVSITLTIAEATAVSGPYTVLSSVALGTVPSGQQLHSTSGLSVPLTAGNVYYFGATWAGGSAANYYAGSGASGNPDWGSFISGGHRSGGTPPATGWSPAGQPGGAYSMEITTGFVPATTEFDADNDSSFNCADCDDTDPNNFPGNTEACDGADNDCDVTTSAAGGETDGDNDNVLACADCDDTDANNYPGNTEACDGADNDCDPSTSAVGGEGDGDNDNVIACLDCDDADGNNYPGNTEVCDGADNDCNGSADFAGGAANTWTQTGGGAISNGDYTKGNVLAATQNTTVTAWGMELDVASGVSITLTVAEASATSGPYTVLSSVSLGTVPGGQQLHATSGLNVPLIAGNSYYFGATWTGGSASNYYAGGGATGDPVWGTFTTGAHASGGTPPATGWSPAGQPGGAYSMEIDTASGLETDDLDNDGATLCIDCDDGDGNNYPGNTEACDGADNDCDATTDAVGGETDGDNDTYLGCADCDDTDGTSYPGAPELCDGVDNDCDGSAGGEGDGDNDGDLTCADCDDNDAANYNGNGELCDGQDNDCNGSADFDAAGEIDADNDSSLSCVDCDDGAATNFPGNTEVCDGLDNDCSGSADADSAGEVDADNDGVLS